MLNSKSFLILSSDSNTDSWNDAPLAGMPLQMSKDEISDIVTELICPSCCPAPWFITSPSPN